MTRVALVSLALVFFAAGCGGGGEPTTLPDVRGERLDLAESRLDRLGLDHETAGGGAFGVVRRSNWQVCDQDPAPGAKATAVQLIVEREGACAPYSSVRSIVPDLLGRPVREAEEELERRGLPYAVEGMHGGPVAKAGSRVCEQQPQPGRLGSRVTLRVAQECEPVVNVRREDLEDAERLLRRQGVRFRIVGFRGGQADKAFWTVCSQRPPAGARTDAVTLYVKRRCP